MMVRCNSFRLLVSSSFKKKKKEGETKVKKGHIPCKINHKVTVTQGKVKRAQRPRRSTRLLKDHFEFRAVFEISDIVVIDDVVACGRSLHCHNGLVCKSEKERTVSLFLSLCLFALLYLISLLIIATYASLSF